MISRAVSIGSGLAAGFAATFLLTWFAADALGIPPVLTLIVAGLAYVGFPRQRLVVIGFASGVLVFTVCLVLLFWSWPGHDG